MDQAVVTQMAEQFLDTETRHAVPQIALACVAAGLSIAAAQRVWWHDVVPAVGSNLLAVAGEWIGWDDAWLAARVIEVRARPPARRALEDATLRAALGPAASSSWHAIARCMRDLLAMPAARREIHACDLELLARHAFAFSPWPLARHAERTQSDVAEARARLAALHPEPFAAVFAPLYFADAPEIAQRLRAALR